MIRKPLIAVVVALTMLTLTWCNDRRRSEQPKQSQGYEVRDGRL